MAIEGAYEPSTWEWVRKQVELIESSGGTEGTTLRGMAVVVMTMRGAKTGKVRKAPVMRVEHEGSYAAVASVGGAPKHPTWYNNLLADPYIELRDGTRTQAMVAREVFGEEKSVWWERAVAAFPNYADYQAKTDRVIPLFVLEPVTG